jgi:ribonuclease III
LAKAVRDLAALQRGIGYQFVNSALLEHALTHVSSLPSTQTRLASYQRLEFLGDRVLGLAIADMLSTAYPQAEEGELARRMAELVRRETCAEVAREWNLGPNIRLGAGEANSGGRKRETILADACEALIGAVFLDGGFLPARAMVASAWEARLTEVTGDRRDAKTSLQELAQSRKFTMPTYTEISRTGPAHRMHFVIEVAVEAFGRAEGTGHSKREAEQNAARALIEQITEREGQA